MTKNLILSSLIAGALYQVTWAFVPTHSYNARGLTILNAENGRRDLLETFAKALGTGALAVSINQSSGNELELLAKLKNPAQDSWKGKVCSCSCTNLYHRP